MTRPLRMTLIGLVLANLCFAYVTEAARWIWLGPFMALALASPWLARWADRLWYRGGWNLAVLGAFALLVHDTTTAGAAHLLEDGLLLATLAQVHLLNNIGRLQKPDILFFNSFLIAIVTSFLSVDVGFSVVFLGYAPLLILGLQQLAAPEAGARGLAGRSALVLVLTLAGFFLIPRDFQRKGFFAQSMRLREVAQRAEVDFSPEVTLGGVAGVTTSNRVVLVVRLRSGARSQVPEHWRGAALDSFDGRRWRPAPERRIASRTRWQRAHTPGVWVRGRGRPAARVEVERLGDTGSRMPVPLGARTVQLSDPGDRNVVRAATDLTFRTIGPPPRSYELGVDTEEAIGEPGSRRATGSLRAHLELPASAVPPSARRLAANLRGQSPDPEAYVQRVAHHLRTQHVYLPPGADGGARDLEEFVRGDAGGHCEYFASAMVVLLRMHSIPCRLVTGYRSDEWDAESGVLVVRARHAHAWVEVFDPVRGWYTVDPTPADDSAEAVARLSAWTRARFWLSGLWTSVTGFNAGSAVAIRRWAAQAVVPLGIALAALVFLARRRRGVRSNAAARRYARLLRRLGLHLRTGETPRELLARAAVDGRKRVRLEEATRRHERARYATSPMSITPGLQSNG